MNSRITRTSLFVIGLAVSSLAHGQLAHCLPAKDCSSKGKPCVKYVDHGAPKSLLPHPSAGTPVVRVRVCTASSTEVCKGGSSYATQSVRVYGYDKDMNEIYAQTLDTSAAGNPSDTGAYTEVKGLAKLTVRCNSPTSGCQVVWQVCRKGLPLAGS